MIFSSKIRSILSLYRQYLYSFQNLRHFSSSANSSSDKDSYVVLSDNGQVIVCWHPEVPFPYEHTKPLPVLDPEFKEEDSVLKLQYRRDAKNRFEPDGPDQKELAKMTYTTKHRWYPPSNRAKKLEDPDPPIDREGI